METWTAGNESCWEFLDCLLPIVEEAQSENKLLIIDTQAGFKADDTFFKILIRAGIAQATSVAALISLNNGLPFSSANFEANGIHFTRGLMRLWGSGSSLPDLGFNSGFPVSNWRVEFLSKEALARNLSTYQEPIPKDVQDAIGDLVFLSDLEDSSGIYDRYVKDFVANISAFLLDPIT